MLAGSSCSVRVRAKKGFQFAPEQWPGRVVKGQGGQRVEDAIITLTGTVEGFHPDDGGNNVLVDTGLLFGGIQQARVFLQEGAARVYAALSQKKCPDIRPIL